MPTWIFALRQRACLAVLASVCLCVPAASAADVTNDFDSTTALVGRSGTGLETPDNQITTPAGTLVRLPGIRPNALALSPDGRLLVTSGRTNELLVLNPVTGAVLQHVAFPADKTAPQAPVASTILQPDKKAQISFTGLVFSPDGSRIFLADVNGDIKVFSVSKDQQVTPLFSFALPPANAPRRVAEIPAGLALSRDGKRIYVALNLSNRVGEFDAATGQMLRWWNVGVEPFDVAVVGDKVYVSNWGGRRPGPDDATGPAGRGTLVRVDARDIASEGSVSIIDLKQNAVKGELLTGLHACALAVSPNGRYVVVANAGSDTLSVIDARTDKIVETICAAQRPGDLFGAQPNALTFDKSGKTLFVCNGTQNAVAVFRFHPNETKYLGLIPVGWFPAAITYDARHQAICVANLKDMGPGLLFHSGQKTKYKTSEYYGSLSLVPVPKEKALEVYTRTALANLRYPLLAQAKLPPRPGVAVRPVPERVGEPSVFHHVIYILKENCAYDQVLGDVATGNGDPELCIFGEKITPNEHKLVRDFVLLDNTYCCSILSADGHEWATTAMATDYLEREFAGWPRSYPAGNQVEERDAMAYSPAGFIWDNAMAHGKTVRDFGEFTLSHVEWKNSTRTNAPTYADCYRDIMDGSNAISFWSEPSVEPLRRCVVTNTIGWSLSVPDVFRARKFIAALHEFETNNNLPDLTILWLPSDHTSAAKYGFPKPTSYLADNDLAFGQVVDAVSHSIFWKDTCIFAIEDDPQNGWDHVSGFRTTTYVASPYTKRCAVVGTQFNQTGLLRTMELMLGLPPMNQMDATATPMFDCFTNVPDFAPYIALTNNIPLNEMNPAPKKINDRQLREDAYNSSRLPLDKEDQCPADLLAHIIWRATKGSHTPYPNWAATRAGDDD